MQGVPAAQRCIDPFIRLITCGGPQAGSVGAGPKEAARTVNRDNALGADYPRDPDTMAKQYQAIRRSGFLECHL